MAHEGLGMCIRVADGAGGWQQTTDGWFVHWASHSECTLVLFCGEGFLRRVITS